jgi:hypothetical protein
MTHVGQAAGPRRSFIIVLVGDQIQRGDRQGDGHRMGLAGWRQGDHGQVGCGPGGESSVQVGGVDQAELLQGRRGQAGLVALVAQEDDAQVAAGDGRVPRLRGGGRSAIPGSCGGPRWRRGSGRRAAGRRRGCPLAGHRWPGRGAARSGRAVRQYGPGLGEQLIDGLRGTAYGHGGLQIG